MSLTLPAADFLRGVESVIACAGTDITLPALNGVHIEWDEHDIVFVATDRYVCGEHTIRAADATRGTGSLNVRLAALKDAVKVVKAAKPELVEISETSVAGVSYRDEGHEFPKWRGLFPASDDSPGIARVAFDPAKLAQLAGPKSKGRLPALVLRFGASPTKPILVTRQGDTDNEYRGLLMPIREETS